MITNTVPFFIVIPLFGAFLIPLITIPAGSKRFRYVPDLLGNLAILGLLILSLVCIGKFEVYKIGGWLPPLGINLVLDGLSVLMLLMVSTISLAATIFSINYMEQYTSKLRYYSLFLLMVAGMNGVILTGDIFNLFVFLEIASISSYALVGFGCEQEELEASFKYLVLGTIASTFILFAIALIYGTIGTLNMAHMSRMIELKGMNNALYFSLILLITGFSLKAALVPFHAWLPDAHPSAPAPISAMLSGLLIKILGVYALIRFSFNIFGISMLIAKVLFVLGILSMIIGVILAIGQWDIKRLLAYHSISQIGYVILAFGIGGIIIAKKESGIIASFAILGGMFHLINHAVFKSLLFLNSGSLVYATGTRELENLGGLRDKMPVTSNTCLIASLSIAGLPPFNGFWSKLIIILACIQARFYWTAFCAVVVSIITLASFLKVQKYAFFEKSRCGLDQVKESPALMCFSMIFLAVLCIGMGLLLIPDLKLILLQPAIDTLTQGTKYAELILGR